MFDKKETVTLPVPGMHCAHCSARAQQCLEALPGVRSAKVSLEQGQAQVTYLPGKVTPEQMRQALQQAGFGPEV